MKLHVVYFLTIELGSLSLKRVRETYIYENENGGTKTKDDYFDVSGGTTLFQ